MNNPSPPFEQKMNKQDNNNEIHVIILAYHGQGHMNQILQFAKRLVHRGAQISLATTLSVSQKMAPKMGSYKSTITLENVHDDTLNPGTKLGFKAQFESFQAQASPNLAALIAGSKAQHKALVYDANLPWAVKVAKEQGIFAAAFSTQACASLAMNYALYVKNSPENDCATVELPPWPVVLPDPEILVGGIPIFIGGMSSVSGLPPIFKMVFQQFETLHLADWVLFNSFDRLESEVIEWMSKIWTVKTVGPTLPSVYLDKRLEDDVDYGFNLFKPSDDACINWLNTKEPGSVVYVAFGSVANLKQEQVVEIAEALKLSKTSFLWVVRETEEAKLPSNFANETSDKGLVVSWCPQLDVLAHKAVGCFVSHCGWNSTMEALSFGVPMLAMPQFLDQIIDAHLVDRVWGVGIQPKGDDKGLVTREEITRCLEEIMLGERGQKIKESAKKWKDLAKEAVDEGGSSDKYIDEFLARIASS